MSGAPGVSSAVENQRPISGRTPSVVRTPWLAVNVRTSSGSPWPVTVAVARRAPDADVLEGLSVVRVGQEDGVGEVGLVDAADRVDDPDERVGIGIGQRFDEHAVDDAEDRRGGADAERERQDGRGGEAGLLPQHARRVAKVLPEIGEQKSARRS